MLARRRARSCTIPVVISGRSTSTSISATAGPANGASRQKPFEELWDALIRAGGLEPTYFHAKKGQALIWAANLLHGGSHQTDPTLTRWSQVTHYYFEGLRLLLANVERSFLWPHLLPPASEYRYGGVGAEYVLPGQTGSSLIHLAEYRQVGLEA